MILQRKILKVEVEKLTLEFVLAAYLATIDFTLLSFRQI